MRTLGKTNWSEPATEKTMGKSALLHSAGSMQMCFGLCSLGVPDLIRIISVQKVSRDEREIYY